MPKPFDTWKVLPHGLVRDGGGSTPPAAPFAAMAARRAARKAVHA